MMARKKREYTIKLRNDKPSRKQLEKKLDILWSQKIKEKGFCERCGRKENLQSAHIFSRKQRGTRWDLKNGVCFCAGCHIFWSHQHPELFRDFVINKIGEKEFESLKIRAYTVTKFSITDLEWLLRDLGG